MTDYLIDTNVISELRRPRPSPRVVAFVTRASLGTLFISDIVVAEIRFGIETVKDATHRGRLIHWLETIVRPMFVGRILPLTEDVLVRWRLMWETARKRGFPIAEPDLMLAATAAEHGMTVVTRDAAPFRRLGIDVLDPWAEHSARDPNP